MMKNQFLVSQSERERTVRLLGYGKKALGAVLLVGLVLLGSMSYDGSRYGSSSVGSSSSGRGLLSIEAQEAGLANDGKSVEKMNNVAVVLNPGPHLLPELAEGKQYDAIAYVTEFEHTVPKPIGSAGIRVVIEPRINPKKANNYHSAANDDISRSFPAIPDLTLSDVNDYITEETIVHLKPAAHTYYIIKTEGDSENNNAIMFNGDTNRFVTELQRRGFYSDNTVLTFIGGKSTEDEDNIRSASRIGYVGRVFTDGGFDGNAAGFVSYDLAGNKYDASKITNIYLLMIQFNKETTALDAENTALKDITTVCENDLVELKKQIDEFAKHKVSQDDLIEQLQALLKEQLAEIDDHVAKNKLLTVGVTELLVKATITPKGRGAGPSTGPH